MSRVLAFIPLRKIDEEKRLVYGIAAEEVLDRSGEIMDYETSAPLFKEWSDGIAEATGGSSLGNLRSMHQPIAAGKLTAIEFDDAAKQIIICAKVVDDGEWAKVLEGVYTGFSMGGSYAKKWKDAENPTITRYTGQPIEMSLVDLPCIPTAHFEVQKAGGSTVLRKFKLKDDPTMKIRTVTNEEVAARATEMAKSAGGAWTDHLTTAREELEKAAADEATTTTEETLVAEKVADAPVTPVEAPVDAVEPAPADAAPATDAVDAPAVEEVTEDVAKTMVSQKWVAPDGSVHDKKDEAVAHVMGKTLTVNPVQAALKAAQAALSGDVADWPLHDAHEQVTKAHTLLTGAQAVRDASGELAKSFYSVKSLAEVLRDLGYATSEVAWCCESRDSVVPEQLATALRATCAALASLAIEEVEETLAFLKSKGYDIGATEGVEKSVLDELTEIAGNDDTMTKAALSLQKMSPPAPELPTGESLEKMVAEAPLFKALETQNVELRKQVDEAVTGIDELRKSIAAMGKRPTEMAPRTNVVEKSAAEAPIDAVAAKAAVTEMMKTPDGQRQLAEAAMRAQPGVSI